MKNLLFLLLVFPIIGIAQTEIQNKFVPQINIIHADFRLVNFHNPIDSLYPKSLAPLHLKIADESKFLLDSVYSIHFNSPFDSSFIYKDYFEYDAKGNVIVKIRFSSCIDCQMPGTGKTELAFDANGNCISYISYNWDTNTKQWVAIVKIDQIYSFDGKPIQYYLYRWESTSNRWINYYKYDYSYGDNNTLIIRVDYTWDPNEILWINSSKTEQYFDENDNILLSTYYRYDTNAKLWVGYKKEKYAYENNKQTLFVKSVWDESSKLWVNAQKSEYSYDPTGNETMEIGYNWNVAENQWDNFYKYNFAIGVNGKVDTLTTFIADTSDYWVGSYKEEYTYDESENEIQRINYEWDITKAQWISHYKYEYTYHSGSQLTSYVSYSWNRTSNSWIPSIKNDFTFDINGNKTKEISHNWNSTDSQWMIYYKFKYFYSLHSITDKIEISNSPNPIVSPNPATDFITITDLTIEPEKCLLCLFDSQGRLQIKKELAISGKYRLDISGIKNGIYFLNLRWVDKQFTKQIIKTDFK